MRAILPGDEALKRAGPLRVAGADRLQKPPDGFSALFLPHQKRLVGFPIIPILSPKRSIDIQKRLFVPLVFIIAQEVSNNQDFSRKIEQNFLFDKKHRRSFNKTGGILIWGLIFCKR